MTLTDIQAADRGTYRCMLINSVGEVKRDIKLDIRCESEKIRVKFNRGVRWKWERTVAVWSSNMMTKCNTIFLRHVLYILKVKIVNI